MICLENMSMRNPLQEFDIPEEMKEKLFENPAISSYQSSVPPEVNQDLDDTYQKKPKVG